MKKLKPEGILYAISGTALLAMTFTAILQNVFGFQGTTFI